MTLDGVMRFHRCILALAGLTILITSPSVCDEAADNATVVAALEDMYIERFGNDDVDNIPPWSIINKWYYEVGTHQMKALATEAHERAGLGENVRTRKLSWRTRWLNFTNENYKLRDIDVVTYSIFDGNEKAEEHETWKEKKKKQWPEWSFTEGVRKDCVFYLYPAEMRAQYRLKEHVCGIRKAKELHDTQPPRED